MSSELLIRAAKRLRDYPSAAPKGLLTAADVAQLDELLERAERGEAVQNALLDLFLGSRERSIWLQDFVAESGAVMSSRERATPYDALPGAAFTSTSVQYECADKSCPWVGVQVNNTDPAPVCPIHRESQVRK